MQKVRSRKLRHRLTKDQTIPWQLNRRLEKYPRDVMAEVKTPLGDSWTPITVEEYIERARLLARGLIGMGLEAGDAIAILGSTSIEWTLLDVASAYAGLVVVPIYETDSAAQIDWIFEDSDIRTVFVDSADRRVLVESRRTPAIRHIVNMDSAGLSSVESCAEYATEEQLDARTKALTSDSLFSIVYTSGTTGKPKGVELTHGNFVDVCQGVQEWSPKLILSSRTRLLMFLPLAHVMARIITHLSFAGRIRIGFVPNIHNLSSDLNSFKPTALTVVPRVLEKVYNGAEAKAGAGFKRRAFQWSANVAVKAGKRRFHGPISLVQQSIAKKLVFEKLREALGGHVDTILSAGAPLSSRLAHFYRGVGINVIEIYGLTELTGPATVTDVDKPAPGTVGPAFPGTSVRLADDGEVLVKGPNVSRGYHNNPVGTAEAFEDGWFKTGDLGALDKRRNLKIIGRKKHLIVTAGGKNVAPDVLQDKLSSHPLISQVVVLGDGKPFISALITLDEQLLPGWLKAHRLPPMSPAEARVNPAVLASLQRAIDRTNEQVSRAESIRKFTVLPGDFTEANGLLTPSMKVRREVVVRRFADEIEAIYNAPKPKN